MSKLFVIYTINGPNQRAFNCEFFEILTNRG